MSFINGEQFPQKNLIMVRKILLLSISLTLILSAYSSDYELFDVDFDQIHNQFSQLNTIENSFVTKELNQQSPILTQINISGLNQLTAFYSVMEPGNFPSFWFTFIFASIGTYTLYGAGAGLIATALVYIISDGNKPETKKAAWGCVTGMLVGGTLKFVLLNLKSK